MLHSFSSSQGPSEVDEVVRLPVIRCTSCMANLLRIKSCQRELEASSFWSLRTRSTTRRSKK